jgi:hypothetical protein
LLAVVSTFAVQKDIKYLTQMVWLMSVCYFPNLKYFYLKFVCC